MSLSDVPQAEKEVNPKVALWAVIQVASALASIPITKADETVLGQVEEIGRKTQERSFFQLVLDSKSDVTPGLWALFLLMLGREWDEQTKGLAVVLPELRRMYPSPGDRAANELLDAAAAALESLGWVGYHQKHEAIQPCELLSRFHRLATATEALGNADTAYDLLAAALDLGSPEGPLRENVARHAIKLALAAGKMHQVAVCSASLSEAIARAADADSQRRLEAFDSCERTIEWLSLTPQPFRQMAAGLLRDVIRPRDYLQTLSIQLFFFLPEEQLLKELKKTLGTEKWPERISTVPFDDWIANSKALWNAQIWDQELDKARLALETAAAAKSAHADWTKWTLEHPAYRRAVPHLRSFLREAEFDRLLLVLTHEMTHVLSLLGGIGTSLTSLRVAAFDTELRLWSLVEGNDVDALEERIASEGAAPLADGEAALLFRAQHGIELTLKARALQDVWLPWFEGLAIFSELADPALDLASNGWVTEAIRNLVDFYPPQDAVGSPELIEAAYKELASQIESQSSAAIERSGPARLREYLKIKDIPYLAGYLAVRGVVSAWRATVSRALTGTETFNMLLHATRFSTFDAVPDLSIPTDVFYRSALQNMCTWVGQLAKISREDIERFLAPVEGARPFFSWKGNHLEESKKSWSAQTDELLQIIRRQLGEALSSAVRQEDLDRFADAHEFVRMALGSLRKKLRTEIEDVLDQRAALVDGLAASGSILPIGRTAAKFFLNVDEKASEAYLATQIRTTEDHVTNHQPSINGFWFPIDFSSGEQIKANYRKLGSPRMEVTRVIDLAGYIWGDGARPSHVLVFSYGDWLEIYGANPAIQNRLGENPDKKASFAKLVRTRLYGRAVERAEADLIARGEITARRTLNWIDRSKSWAFAEYRVNAEPWVGHIRSLAQLVLRKETRLHNQTEAARSLLSSLFGDACLAEDIVKSGFENLTENTGESRTALVDVLFKTAQQPKRDARMDEVGAAFASSALPILSLGKLGWDVRPALTVSAKGAA